MMVTHPFSTAPLPKARSHRYRRLEAVATKGKKPSLPNGWKQSLPNGWKPSLPTAGSNRYQTAGSHRYQRLEAIVTGAVEKVPISSSRARR